MSKLKTTMTIADAGLSIPLIIAYKFHREWLSPGRESPDEPAHCEVTGVVADVHVPPIGFLNMDWLVDELNADDEMQSVLMDCVADEEAAAAEYRADQRADEAMVRKWEEGK